jgi:hypothetical protein
MHTITHYFKYPLHRRRVSGRQKPFHVANMPGTRSKTEIGTQGVSDQWQRFAHRLSSDCLILPSYLPCGEISSAAPRLVRPSPDGVAFPQRLRRRPNALHGVRTALRRRISLFGPEHRRPEFVMLAEGHQKELPGLQIDPHWPIVPDGKDGRDV